MVHRGRAVNRAGVVDEDVNRPVERAETRHQVADRAAIHEVDGESPESTPVGLDAVAHRAAAGFLAGAHGDHVGSGSG